MLNLQSNGSFMLRNNENLANGETPPTYEINFSVTFTLNDSLNVYTLNLEALTFSVDGSIEHSLLGGSDVVSNNVIPLDTLIQTGDELFSVDGNFLRTDSTLTPQNSSFEFYLNSETPKIFPLGSSPVDIIDQGLIVDFVHVVVGDADENFLGVSPLVVVPEASSSVFVLLALSITILRRFR